MCGFFPIGGLAATLNAMNEPAADDHKDLDAPIWARSVLTFDIDAQAAAQGDCVWHRISLTPADW
jgi:hypothetical protein